MQAKPKAAPRGGVSSSMLILESEVVEHGIALNAAEARDKDEYYAMVDSGTNAIILPLHPKMEGDIAECQVPSATVTGPIVQIYEFNGSKRLVVALPQSTILVSQEWLTTIAEWEFTSGPTGSGSECRVTPAGSSKSYVLSIRKVVLACYGPYVQESSAGKGTLLGRTEGARLVTNVRKSTQSSQWTSLNCQM